MEQEVDGILVAAHELKAPLAVLRQLAFSFDGMDSRNEHIRSEMIGVSERAIRQVNDLIKVRRLEEGLFVMEPVSVRAVCDEVTEELNNLFLGKKQRLSIKYTNKNRLVTANRELLRSVIYNFLINAVHYTSGNTEAKLLVKDHKGKVEISVRDYGPELPWDIWKEMRRGWISKPTSIAMRPGSSGLGLFIASRFSRYMNAEIGAVRHRDGTSFYVDLPVSKQARLFK